MPPKGYKRNKKRLMRNLFITPFCQEAIRQMKVIASGKIDEQCKSGLMDSLIPQVYGDRQQTA